jgi:hypothetical protein
MFEETERPLTGFLRTLTVQYMCDQKSFPICKFLKLLPVRDRGN